MRRPTALVKIPGRHRRRAAAAMLLKGMTTEAFIRRTYPVKAGETVLVHAAVGGVGQIMTQWLKALGAEVIATVGSRPRRPRPAGWAATTSSSTASEDVAAECKRDHRRQGRAGGLRLAWARTPSRARWAAWRGGACSSASATRRAPCAPFAPARLAARRLAVPDPADPVRPTSSRPRSWRPSAAAVFDVVKCGQGEGRDRPDLRAGGRAQGARGAGEAGRRSAASLLIP